MKVLALVYPTYSQTRDRIYPEMIINNTTKNKKEKEKLQSGKVCSPLHTRLVCQGNLAQIHSHRMDWSRHKTCTGSILLAHQGR